VLGADTDRLLLGVAVFLLALLTVRTSVMLNYINYDLAKEFLVYAHGAPDAKVGLSQIEEGFLAGEPVRRRTWRLGYGEGPVRGPSPGTFIPEYSKIIIRG